EDLGLVLQAAKGLGVDDPIPVPLKGRPEVMGLLVPLSTLGVRGQRGPLRERGPFEVLDPLTWRGHAGHTSIRVRQLRGAGFLGPGRAVRARSAYYLSACAALASQGKERSGPSGGG